MAQVQAMRACAVLSVLVAKNASTQCCVQTASVSFALVTSSALCLLETAFRFLLSTLHALSVKLLGFLTLIHTCTVYPSLVMHLAQPMYHWQGVLSSGAPS